MEFEEDPIINLKSFFQSILVRLLPHSLLPHVYVLFEVLEKAIAILESDIQQMDWRRIQKVGRDRGWRIAIDRLEGCHFDGRLKGGVIPPFRPWEPSNPSSWFVHGKAAKIVLQCPVKNLCLAIRLWVIAELLQNVVY